MEELDQALEPERAEQEETQSIIVEHDTLIAESVSEEVPEVSPTATLRAVIEAAIYITDEPLTAEQIALAVEQPLDLVKSLLGDLVNEYASPTRGLSIREIAGGYKMSTKAEHHELIRRFVNKLQPPLKLSQAALETLAVVAYKQPITGPEILEIRGVQGAGVVKTLLDRKLIAAAGRKDILGKPILYKTTREFLIQFGLNSLAELPTLKEFEELGRFALSEAEEPVVAMPAPSNPPEESSATEESVVTTDADGFTVEHAESTPPSVSPIDETAAGNEASQVSQLAETTASDESVTPEQDHSESHG